MDDASNSGAIDQIMGIGAAWEIARFCWKDRGIAPAGYIKGMALVYARVYCDLKAGADAAVELAKAETGDTNHDAELVGLPYPSPTSSWADKSKIQELRLHEELRCPYGT